MGSEWCVLQFAGNKIRGTGQCPSCGTMCVSTVVAGDEFLFQCAVCSRDSDLQPFFYAPIENSSALGVDPT